MADTTLLWAFFKQHNRLIFNVLLGILLFASGWQLGRAMSPYYDSRPIVFQDRECTNCASSGGSVAELQDIQEQGIASREEEEGEPEVAGAQTAQGEYVASVNSNLFHHVSCSSASRISPQNQVWFATIDEAQGAGYSPSKCTEDLLAE